MSFMLGGFANGLFQGAEGIFRMYGEAQHAHYYQALAKRMNFETEREQKVWEDAQKAGKGDAEARNQGGALPTSGPGAPPVKNAPTGDMPDPSKLPPPPYLLDAKSTESTFAKTPYTSPEKPEPTFATTARESANRSATALAPGKFGEPTGPNEAGMPAWMMTGFSPPSAAGVPAATGAPAATAAAGTGPGGEVSRNPLVTNRPRTAVPMPGYGIITQAPAATAAGPGGEASRNPYVTHRPVPAAGQPPRYLPPQNLQALPMRQDAAPPQTPVLMPQIAPAAGPGGGLTQNGPSMMPNMASSAPGIGAAILASMNPMAGATA